jgi:hypothetical protein
MLTEQQASDFARYAIDPIVFIEEQIKIRTVDRGIVPFILYDWQKKLIKILMTGKHIIMLKSRQIGASWAIGAFINWLTIFRRHQEILILSRNGESARNLLRHKILAMLYTVPSWIIGNEEIRLGEVTKVPARFTVIHSKYDPARECYVRVCENIVSSLTTTSDSGTGETPNFVFLDEWAKLPHSDDIWAALKPALSRGGQIAGVSTPKGHNNSFARVWNQWEAGTLIGWIGMCVSFRDSGFDAEWLANAASGMTDEQIQQEFYHSFLQSGRPVFPASKVAEVYRPLTHPGGHEALMEEYANILSRAGLATDRQGCEDEFSRVRELVQDSDAFYSGVDSSEGKGRDYNSVTTLNNHGVQVATEHNHMSITQWAGATIRENGEMTEIPGFVSKWHNQYPGIMIIEENGPGIAVYNRHIAPLDGVSRAIKKRAADTAARTGLKTKIIIELQRMIETKQIIITDRFTYRCLMDYSYIGDTGRTGAPKGLFDDPVLSLAWAVYAIITYGSITHDWSSRSTKSDARIFRESAWSIKSKPYGTMRGAIGPRLQRDDMRPGGFDVTKIRDLRPSRMREPLKHW